MQEESKARPNFYMRDNASESESDDEQQNVKEYADLKMKAPEARDAPLEVEKFEAQFISSKVIEETQPADQSELRFGECTVCLELIEGQVMMCTNCSSLFCQSCINHVLKNHCPACRKVQKITAYARIRPIEEQIKKLRQDAVKMRCKPHNLEQIYFCGTCKAPCCPENFIEHHLGHDRKYISKEDEVCHQKVVNAIEKAHTVLEQLDERQAKLKALRNCVEERLAELNELNAAWQKDATSAQMIQRIESSRVAVAKLSSMDDELQAKI